MIDPALLLAIDSVPCLRWSEKLKMLDSVRTMDDFRRLDPVDAAVIAGRRLRNSGWNANVLAGDAERTCRAALSRKIGILPYGDPEFPPQLREIYDPPFLLFCRGRIPSWEYPFLGIVGTRGPSGSGRKASYGLAFEAAGRGVTVVSGLARGIDGEAHRGSLDGGGCTVAVLGNGADSVYPASHRALAARILDSGGLLITEFAPGAGVRKHHFPSRNRIISGLCRGVVVVEAPARSGALITADYALEQGRDLFVHGDCLSGPSGEGTRRLADDGAPVIVSLDDVCRDWSSAGSPGGGMRRAAAARTGGGPGRTLALFMEEELAGTAARHQGHYFRRTENG